MFERNDPVPLLSDYPKIDSLHPPSDLRCYLPDRVSGNRFLEAFRVNIQYYKPIFYWPSLERKVQRAYNDSIWENDARAISEVFCIVMIVMGVGAQLVRTNEPKESQER